MQILADISRWLVLAANDKIDFSKRKRIAQAGGCGNCGQARKKRPVAAQDCDFRPLESGSFVRGAEVMEASEIHEFSEQVQEGAEKRLKYVSLVIAVLAVLVAMVTVLGHREHTRAVLEQTRAADQWNEYQSRKLRVQQTQKASELLTLLAPASAA